MDNINAIAIQKEQIVIQLDKLFEAYAKKKCDKVQKLLKEIQDINTNLESIDKMIDITNNHLSEGDKNNYDKYKKAVENTKKIIEQTSSKDIESEKIKLSLSSDVSHSRILSEKIIATAATKMNESIDHLNKKLITINIVLNKESELSYTVTSKTSGANKITICHKLFSINSVFQCLNQYKNTTMDALKKNSLNQDTVDALTNKLESINNKYNMITSLVEQYKSARDTLLANDKDFVAKKNKIRILHSFYNCSESLNDVSEQIDTINTEIIKTNQQLSLIFSDNIKNDIENLEFTVEDDRSNVIVKKFSVITDFMKMYVQSALNVDEK